MKTKNFLNLKSWLLMLVMLLGIGNAWAESITKTFNMLDISGFKSYTSNVTYTLNDVAWTLETDGTGYLVLENNKGIHAGSSSKTVSYLSMSTFDIQGTIKSVVVEAANASGVTSSVEVSVGGNSYGTKSLTSSFAQYTFDGSSKGQILVRLSQTSQKKALYLYSISVTYETDGGGGSTTYSVILGDDNSTLTETSGGAGVTLPSRPAIGSYTFAGWSETNVASETTTAPTIIPAGSYTPTGDITLYPVYSKTESGASAESSNVFSSGSYVNPNITWTIDGVVSITQTQGGGGTAPNSSYVSAPRWYSGNIITITPSVSINYISVTANTENYATALANSTYTNANASAYGKAVTITPTNGSSAITIVMGGQSRLSSLTVNYSGGTTYYWSSPVAAAVEAPTFSLAEGTYEGTQNVEVSCITQGATIYYTTDGSDPTSDSTPCSGAVTIDHSCTLKAIAVKDEVSSEVASATYVILDPNRPGTENNPYTVEQVMDYIDGLDGATSDMVYVKGIVSQVDEFISKYSSITYWISDDGTTNNQFECYSGKGLNSTNFSSINDVQIGDVVTVAGTVKKYGETYEFNYNNYLVSLERPSFEITAQANDNTMGSVSLEENVITATPAAGYRFATPAYTVTSGTATVTQDGNEFVVNATSDCTVTINFEKIPEHNVVWSVNGTETTTTALEDAAVEFPAAPEAIEGKTFVGWVTEAIDGETDEAPAFVTSATMGTADVTYYAVFASQEGSGVPASLTKMTSNDTFATGDKVVIVANDEVAMYQETTKSSYVNKYTYDNSVATVAADDKNWLSVSAGSTAKTWKLGDDTNGYVYNSSSNNLSISQDNSTDFTLAWDETESKFTLVGNNRWLSYRSDLDNTYFRMGGQTSGNASGDIYFDIYKYNEANIAYSGYCTTVIKPVAKIGNKGFETLQAAVDAATEEDNVVTLLTDINLASDNVSINKAVTIKGEGHTIVSKATQAIAISGAGNVTIDNTVITSQNRGINVLNVTSGFTLNVENSTIQTNVEDPTTTYTTGENSRGINIANADGVTVNISNSTIQGYSYNINIPTSGKNLIVNMTGGKTYGRAAVNNWGSNNTITLDGVEVHGLNNQTGPTEAFACVVDNNGAQNNTFVLKDCQFTGTLSEAALAAEGSTASEHLLSLRGTNAIVKVLGSTTYSCNSDDKTRGGIVFTEQYLMNNKLYFDDTTKQTFANAFELSVIADEKEAEVDLYPVNFEPEVLYYWAVEDGYNGGYHSFADPFKNGWLADGEFIALQKDITLTEDITCQLASGASFNFLLGEFTADKNGHSVALNTGVTVLTDKPTDIFKAAEAGYVIVETETETGYSYTAEKVMLAQPIIFHDGGKYEGELTVAIAGEGVKYTLNGGAEQTYTQPFTISETTTVTAWAEQDGIKSAEVSKTFTIVPVMTGATIEGGYYNITTSDGKYVNVAGRKTVTLVENAEGMPGTVIRVETNDKGQVAVLRSQGVDLPRYAERAMSYVSELAKEVVNKLAANVDDPIIGEQGVDLILAKFNKEFDYHLYLEEANGGYRIYGRTPSMKPVVDFYAENKDLVDSRLPHLESFVKDILQRIADKMERGYSLVDMFSIRDIWTKMTENDPELIEHLTEPDSEDEAATMKFYEQVLSSEKNVWDFAYNTAMIYWEKVKGYLNENAGDLGDYGKYLEKIPNVQPNFMYYIVPSASGVDIISQGNVAIENDEASAIWTLTPCEKFVAKMNVVSEKNIYTTTANETKSYTEYYTTLYTDFAYTLPEGVTAYKINGINTKYNTVLKEAIKSATIPAQTPVLLFTQNESVDLIPEMNDVSALSGNELYGNDWLINKYPLNTPQLETIFAMLTKLSSSLGEKYEHLKRLNAGTVNNKYFFNLAAPTEEGDFKEDFNNGKIKVLSNGENGIGFYSNFDKNLVGNEAFMFSEGYNPIMLSLIGDVNRDGDISIADVTALVNIILGKAKYPDDLDKYDFDAANVNRDTQISIADVTKLVNIILGKE